MENVWKMYGNVWKMYGKVTNNTILICCFKDATK